MPSAIGSESPYPAPGGQRLLWLAGVGEQGRGRAVLQAVTKGAGNCLLEPQFLSQPFPVEDWDGQCLLSFCFSSPESPLADLVSVEHLLGP